MTDLDECCLLCGSKVMFSFFACFVGCSDDECNIVVCNGCMSNEKEIKLLEKNGHRLVSD